MWKGISNVIAISVHRCQTRTDVNDFPFKNVRKQKLENKSFPLAAVILFPSAVQNVLPLILSPFLKKLPREHCVFD